MNKPLGVVCTKESDSHKTVFDLLPENLKDLAFTAKRGQRLHTVGRLDSNTSGLLLLTTDGFFSHFLTSPENKILKTYKVTVKNPVNEEKQKEYVKACAKGVILPAEKKAPEQQALPSILEWNSEIEGKLTVSEGKFHEVRRTFLALQNEVTELCRLSIGSFELDCNLQPGQWRELTEVEIKKLCNCIP